VGQNNKAIKTRGVLIIVENLPSPFDRRVWQEANTLHDNGSWKQKVPSAIYMNIPLLYSGSLSWPGKYC